MEHWADVDNRPIDFSTTTLPPQLRTLTDAQITANNNTFNKLTTTQRGTSQSMIPKAMLIQGHMFWGADGKSGGLQRYVLSRADTLGHKVCVILEDCDRRLYGFFLELFQVLAVL